MSGTGQQTINLSRVQRCDQDWDRMPQVHGGRRCLLCDKRIIDLTRLTPAEIARVHLSNAEPVCGRYTDEQLRWAPHEAPPSDPWRRAPALVSLVSLLLAEPTEAVAQQTAPMEHRAEAAPDRSVPIEQTAGLMVVDSLMMRGRVLERVGEKSEGVPFVNVQVVGTGIGAVTDLEGHFALDLSTLEGSTDPVLVEVMYVGYARQRQHVVLHNTNELVFDFTGKEQNAIVYAVKYKRPAFHKRVWWGVKGFFTGEY